MQRAVPVFADIDPTTGNISPASIQAVVTSKTKAVIPVHWGGYPCDLDEINAVASRHGLTVIEDAAHALGASYRGKPIGSISRFTAFSFQAIKSLTTGDGGALCCPSESDAAAARRLRWFGIDRSRSRPSLIGARQVDIAELGYKYHMNDVAAAIGFGNLEDFPLRLARRRSIAAHYRAEFSHVRGITLLRNDPDRQPAYWFFSFLVDRREDFVRRLAEKGVPASVIDLGIDSNSVFGGPRPELANQRYFDAHHIALPVHDALSQSDIELIVATVRGGW
jgi:perosamine synthetase